MTSVAHSVAKSVGFHIGAQLNSLPSEDSITFEGDTEPLTFEGDTENITFELIEN